MEETKRYRPIETTTTISWDMDMMFELLDNVQNAILVIDAKGIVQYINKEYTKYLGIPPEKLLGRALHKIEPKALALQVLETRQTIYNKVDYIESLKIYAIGVTMPLFDKDKELAGSASIFNNLTKIVEMSNELERAKEMEEYLREQLSDLQLPQSFRDYICENNKHKKTLHLAARVAQTDSTILILGECGVGKEVMAKVIHSASKRDQQPFIKVNCASIPENLLESELFGYEDGAFTGARKGGKMGKFELANNGTIFLDEIGDMSFNMQAKLLRVLQERELERVGGTRVIPLNIRIIAATNQNLEKMIKEGSFRSDLYYRLNVFSITIPALRERPEDIKPLTSFLLAKLTQGKEVVHVSSPVSKILNEFSWPGNVRELENVLEYANIVRTGNIITIKDLPRYMKPELPVEEVPADENKRFNLKTAVAVLERDYIMEAIKECQGNKSLAIRELGISRRAFYEKLEKYGLVERLDEGASELHS